MHLRLFTCLAAVAVASAAYGQHDPTSHGAVPAGAAALEGTATLEDARGRPIGHVTLRDSAAGMLLTIELAGAPPGPHAFHIHSVGVCEPPSFTSAGDHFAPGGTKHGLLSQPGGEGESHAHAGDLPNLHVPAGGALSVELLVPFVRLGSGEHSVLDEDGSALVLHAKPDDYRTDPAGNAGDRIACGVIRTKAK